MTSDETKATLLRQIEGMPPDAKARVRGAADILETSTTDAQYLQNTMTVIAALKFIEYLATGVEPQSDAVQ